MYNSFTFTPLNSSLDIPIQYESFIYTRLYFNFEVTIKNKFSKHRNICCVNKKNKAYLKT